MADDARRAFYWVKRVTNMDFNVCGKRASLQQHGVTKGDVLRRVIPRDGAESLVRRSRVEIGCAEADRIWRYLRRPAKRFRTGQPATVIRHVGNQAKNGFWRAFDSRREPRVQGGHLASFH